MIDCLIVGAGPYGLSLAAHLRAHRIDFRIVGTPMGAWLSSMPDGMHLKSEGFACNLFEPSGTFTLKAFCVEQAIPYADTGLPVRKDTFVAYGLAFQKRYVPGVEDRSVVAITRYNGGFNTRLADGDFIRSRRVVIAAGVGHYARILPSLAALGPSNLSHSSDHNGFAGFVGQHVAVVGGGSSAMDIAAALRRQGASVTVIARRAAIRFQTPLGPRTLRNKIRAPMTSVGPGWKAVLCTKAPLLFHAMPAAFRTKVVQRYLGPAPAWFVRDQVEGHVPILSGTTVRDAAVEHGRARLTLTSNGGQTSTLIVDHVISATGYKVAVDRIAFLDADIKSAVMTIDGAPRLSRNFESALHGLHFIGPAAANSFGPMVRFAAGAGFTARRLSRHLAASALRASQPRPKASRRSAAVADG
jgi:cation diffusion facilitator CzcD-associated flavoprotein CzcO